MNLRDTFNKVATIMGGIGTFLFGMGTITEITGNLPADAQSTPLLTFASLCVSAALLYVGIRGMRNAAKDRKKPPSDDPPGPKP